MPVLRKLNIHSTLALAGIFGPAVLVIGDLTASLSNPQYNLVRDSISSLALTPIGWLQTIGFLAMGLLVEIFVAGLLFNIRGVRGFRPSIGLLVFFGFGLLLIGAFRTDPVGVSRTIEGTIHSVMAGTVFWLFPIAVLLLSPSLRRDPQWKNIFVYTVIAGIFALVLATGLLFRPDEANWWGLYERVLVANIVIWVEVAAIRLLCLSIGCRELTSLGKIFQTR
jgi:hypothetical protein